MSIEGFSMPERRRIPERIPKRPNSGQERPEVKTGEEAAKQKVVDRILAFAHDHPTATVWELQNLLILWPRTEEGAGMGQDLAAAIRDIREQIKTLSINAPIRDALLLLEPTDGTIN